MEPKETKEPRCLEWAEHAMDVSLTHTVLWDIDMPPLPAASPGRVS